MKILNPMNTENVVVSKAELANNATKLNNKNADFYSGDIDVLYVETPYIGVNITQPYNLTFTVPDGYTTLCIGNVQCNANIGAAYGFMTKGHNTVSFYWPSKAFGGTHDFYISTNVIIKRIS